MGSLSKMSVRSTEHRWFDLGAAALDRLLVPKLGDKYVCPLCRDSFDRSQIATDLTVEHAPPSSIGGRGIALTCRACNSRSGSQLDAELLHHHNTRQLARGGTAVYEDVETTQEGTLAARPTRDRPRRTEVRPHRTSEPSRTASGTPRSLVAMGTNSLSRARDHDADPHSRQSASG